MYFSWLFFYSCLIGLKTHSMVQVRITGFVLQHAQRRGFECHLRLAKWTKGHHFALAHLPHCPQHQRKQPNGWLHQAPRRFLQARQVLARRPPRGILGAADQQRSTLPAVPSTLWPLWLPRF
jgi:hypothetical protein